MTKKKNFNTGLLVSALLFVLGIVCWILQLTQGLQLTNLNNYNTWGFYIVCFALFTGVGAGSLLFTSSAGCLRVLRPFAPIPGFPPLLARLAASLRRDCSSWWTSAIPSGCGTS